MSNLRIISNTYFISGNHLSADPNEIHFSAIIRSDLNNIKYYYISSVICIIFYNNY